jgi:hypothetical protein
MSGTKHVRCISDVAVKIPYHVATGSRPSVLEFSPGQEQELSEDLASWLVGGSFPDKFVLCSAKSEKPAAPAAPEPAAPAPAPAVKGK